MASFATNEKVPKPWQCGDDYQYPLPGPDGDPWNTLLKPLLDRDKVKCDAWTDEVQNLLIFAGLFSAVVTAFVVETYKDLQEDPVVALLAQIAARSANVESTQPFSPSSSTIRLNVFLFLSLILSLTTVLVGIVALQWIREHRQLSNTLTPQNMFATMHMRTEALHKWRVPQIFAALPLLLQCALVLFFAGIIQLLVDASTTVLIPVASVIGVTIIFLLLTTILPTAQAATLNHTGLRLNEDIPVPCPYKSPQAKAFRRLATSSEIVFGGLSFVFASIYWIIFRVTLLPRQFASFSFWQKVTGTVHTFFRNAWAPLLRLLESCSVASSVLTRQVLGPKAMHEWHGFDYMKPNIYYYWKMHSWLQFDLAWMSVRDNYFQSICPSDSWLFLHREESREYAGLYDATQGLCDELTSDNFNINVNPEPAIINAYHCALSLCFPSVGHFDPDDAMVVKALFTRNQYLSTLLGSGELTPLRPFSDAIKPADFQILWEETSFIFLYSIQEQLVNAGKSATALTAHYAEVYLRLLGQLYSEPYEMNSTLASGDPPEVVFDGEDLYVMKVYDAPNQPFTHQWAVSITSFFRVLAGRSIPYSKLTRSFHAHPFFRGYSANFWRQLKYETHTGVVHDDTIREVLTTLTLISDTLDSLPGPRSSGQDQTEIDDDTLPRAQLVLHAAAAHLWLFIHRDIQHHALAPAMERVIPRLLDTKSRLTSAGVELDARVVADCAQSSTSTDSILWFTPEWWAEFRLDFPVGHTVQHNGTSSSSTSAKTAESVDTGHGDKPGTLRMTMPSPQLPPTMPTLPPPWAEPFVSNVGTAQSTADVPSTTDVLPTSPTWPFRLGAPTTHNDSMV